MATPEFRGTSTGVNLAVPVGEAAAVNSSSVRAATRSLVGEDPEDLQPFKQSTLNCSHLDDKPLKVTEDSFNASQKCLDLEVVRSEKGANGLGGTFGGRLFVTIILKIF